MDATLRERIVMKLRDTRPGGEPVNVPIAGLTEEQTADIRKLLPTEFAPAAVLVPLVERPEGLTVLLTQRASHLKHHAGQISFPGGRVEPQDAGAWEAALRESEEEIGLSREYVSLAGYLGNHIVITGYLVTPAVAFVRPGFELRLDLTEVDEVFEVPLEFILDPANHVPRERRFGGHAFRAWDIPWQGRNIWGATAGMLLSLGRLLREE